MSIKTNKQKVGKIGEDIICRFLMKQDFQIIERNYWKKWGEIDIIAKKSNILHFVEVKTVSYKNLESVIYETDKHRPEENVHPWKLKKLSRVIQTYLLEKDIIDIDWRFDVAAVYLDMANKKAKVKLLENIIL